MKAVVIKYMKTGEHKFLSSDGVSFITYYTFLPEKPPVAVLQICHGMAEYILRYADFASFLTEQGVVVCGCDHPGHGKSVQKGDVPGYFGKGKTLQVLVDNQRLLFDLMRRKYCSLPYILLGHSMGSFVARRYMLCHKDTVDGVILCGTAGPGMPAGLGVVLSRLVSLFISDAKPSPFIGRIAFAGYNKRTGSSVPNSWLTRDSETVRAYNKDPLCGFPFTPSAYRQLFEAIKEVNSAEWANEVPKSLPVLVASGDNDPVGAYGIGPSRVYEALKDAELCDLSLKLYPGARHEILNETNRKEVYGDFLSFILHVTEGVRAARVQGYPGAAENSGL